MYLLIAFLLISAKAADNTGLSFALDTNDCNLYYTDKSTNYFSQNYAYGVRWSSFRVTNASPLGTSVFRSNHRVFRLNPNRPIYYGGECVEWWIEYALK